MTIAPATRPIVMAGLAPAIPAGTVTPGLDPAIPTAVVMAGLDPATPAGTPRPVRECG